ncbi:hypothetical protein [Microbacterium profundi]|nr:hypothetical protein [Microbacterium profundi]
MATLAGVSFYSLELGFFQILTLATTLAGLGGKEFHAICGEHADSAAG